MQRTRHGQDGAPSLISMFGGHAERSPRSAGASAPLTRRLPILREEAANHLLFVFGLDPSEQPGTQILNRLGAIERQSLVHAPAFEMTGPTMRLEDGAHVAGEVDALHRRRRGWRDGSRG